MGGERMDNIISQYILFFMIGIMMGCYGSLLFFRLDQSWKQLVLGIGTAFTTGGVGVTFIKYLSIPQENISRVLLILIIGVILSIYIAFRKFCQLLKKEAGDNVIRILDIILGCDKKISEYYQFRIRATEDEADSDKEKQKKKEREQQEKYLIEFKNKMDEQKKDALILKLPEYGEVPITNSFIRKIPMCVDNICRFKNNVDKLTEEFCEKFSEDKENNKELLKAYFVGIGMYVSNDLFGSSGTNIRTHFRILKDNQYIKYTAVLGSKISDDEMTSIPKDSNCMINKSFELRKSLIASMNPDSNYDTKTKWDDYMTITYYNLIDEEEPFLSMGISIKYADQYGDMLYFFNFYKIEECLESYIKMIDSKCGIINTLQ